MTGYAGTVLVVDKTASVPMYRQIKDQVREAVDNGTWAAGHHLPSERELIDSLGVSRITVRQALRELVAEGYLVSAAGKGFFVAARSRPQELDALLSHTAAMRAKGVQPGSRVLACLVQRAGPAVARSLHIAEGDEVVHLARVRLGDGVPLTLQRVWVPHDLAPGLTTVDFEHTSLLEYLRQRHGVVFARAQTTINCRLADPGEAAELELPDPPLALTVDQTSYATEGRVIELSRSLHHPARMPVGMTHAVSPNGLGIVTWQVEG